MATNPGHWVHRLPGGLAHNNLSHSICKIADLLPDDRPAVWATWFGDPSTGGPSSRDADSPARRECDRVRALSQHRPAGPAAGPSLRNPPTVGGRLRRPHGPGSTPPAAGPMMFAKLVIPARNLVGSGRALARNTWRFLRGDLQYFTGMNELFRRFYRSVREGTPPPVPTPRPPRRDHIRRRLRCVPWPGRRRTGPRAGPGLDQSPGIDGGPGMTAFVTGGTGFLGRRVVARLLAAGERIRCLVRPGTDPAVLRDGLPATSRLEIIPGSLGPGSDLRRALGRVRHRVPPGRRNARGSTRPVPDECSGNPGTGRRRQRTVGVRRFVLVSSIAVYDSAPGCGLRTYSMRPARSTRNLTCATATRTAKWRKEAACREAATSSP